MTSILAYWKNIQGKFCDRGKVADMKFDVKFRDRRKVADMKYLGKGRECFSMKFDINI